MVGQDFIFFLQNKQNLFWGLDASGQVTISANPYPLVYSPDGWDEISIKNIRNRKYWAVDRSVSIPFKYVEDGAKIMKHVFYTKGVEEPLYLVICEQQLYYDPGVDYGYWYKQIYKAEVDLSTFQHDGPIVTATTLEEGLAKHLKANENTVYEFPLDTVDAVKVKMDGIVLKNKLSAIVENGFSLDGDYFFGNHIAELNIVQTELEFGGGAKSTVRTKVTNSNTAIRATGQYFFKATVATTVTFNYNFRVTVQYTPDAPGINPGAVYRIVVRQIDESNISTLSHFIMERTAAQGIPGVYDIVGTGSLSVNPGDELYLYTFCNVEGAGGDIQLRTIYEVTDTTIFSAEYNFRFADTFLKALRPQTLFNELLHKMTDGEYSADDCPYFGSLQHFDKVFTSGDGIREIADAKLKISFSHFFSFWNTFDEVGIRVKENKVLFDRKKVLIDELNIIDLGEVSKLSTKLDKTFAFNELAIGYPDVKNEQGILNGRNEFNTTFTFSLGTTKTPKKLEKTSYVRVSCYDIEYIRIKLGLKDSTDNKNDGEPYVLHIEDAITADAYNLDRSVNSFLLGVDEKDSIFNVELSPKRSLLRSGDFLRSSLYKCDNKKLKFISAERNDKMEYINGADFIIEKNDETLGSLADKFFEPVILEFDTDAPIDLLDLLDSNPLQIFQFTFDGFTYKGIALETGINPKTNKKQQYQLLSHPSNDLSKLIDFYGG